MAHCRFGILGTGNIARQFASSMATSHHCRITAVGSRSIEAAHAFIEDHCPPPSDNPVATTYEGVLASPDVDAVYVSLPNSLHAEWTIAALRTGKHVLCEKPLAMSLPEAEAMFTAARAAGRLLVEAFMYVSHPLTQAYVSAVRSGAVGTLRHIRASFCYKTSKIAGNVRFDPSLGGGALMDIGCYCLHFSRMIAGAEPVRVWAEGSLHPSGVDEQASVLLRFPGNLTASFTCGMTLQADNTATISGDAGYLEVPVPWKPPVKNARYALAHSTPPKMDSAVSRNAPPPPRQEFLLDAVKDLYALEADDFALAIQGTKPPAISPEDSLGNMALLDKVRNLIRV